MKACIRRMALSLLVSGLFVFLLAALERPVSAQQNKSGAQIWAENCGRCHNVRSPKERSDRQWEIIVLHMRTRANLLAQEAKKILEFLQQSN
ncbi:MAG: cytochrome c [Candidatus Binatia bacterium]